MIRTVLLQSRPFMSAKTCTRPRTHRRYPLAWLAWLAGPAGQRIQLDPYHVEQAPSLNEPYDICIYACVYIYIYGCISICVYDTDI